MSHAVYIIEDGVTQGPFMYSDEWKLREKHKELIFGNEERWKRAIETIKTTFDHTPIHVAREYILALEIFLEEAEERRDEAIELMAEARKELSRIKRNNKS